MNRRSLLKYASLLGTAPLAAGAERLMGQGAKSAKTTTKPIVLYCDLAVDPKREQEMLDAYHNHFRPVAVKFPGYIDLKIVKIRSVISGYAPPKGVNYRFQLTYESEEARQKWIHSAVHIKNWPLIENTVLDKNYQTLLTDEV
jgi:antibiotic biosynthesis monooxygenase (ABM) superfamily enzyme